MNIFSSDRTRNAYPIIEYFEQLLPKKKPNAIYVITPNDLESPAFHAYAELNKKLENNEITRVSFNYQVSELRDQAIQDIEKFMEDTYPILMDHASSEEILDILIENAPAMASFSDNITDYDSFFSIMLLPTEHFSPAKFYSGVTNIPADSLSDDGEFLTEIIVHELGHAGQIGSEENRSLSREVVADLHALNQKDQLNKIGLPVSEETIKILFYYRDIGAVNDALSESHATGIFMPVRGLPDLEKVTIDNTITSLRNLKDSIAYRLGNKHFSTNDYMTIVQNLLDGIEIYEGFGIADIDTSDIQVLENIITDPNELSGQWPNLSETAQNYLGEGMRIVDKELGSKIMTRNHKATYEAVRDIYLSDEFQQDLIAQYYAYNFLQSAKMLNAQLFGASLNEHIPTPELKSEVEITENINDSFNNNNP